MSPDAIVLMLVAIALIWGGLIVNIWKLRYRNAPEEVIQAASDPSSSSD